MSKVETIVIDNFFGSMTSYPDGPLNSGLSDVIESSGQDPFFKPRNLRWMEVPTQIDSAGDVITDLILAGKSRVESGIVYVYAIGHTGRLYKIQVNDPTTYNPDYDNPVLLATLSAETPTFTRGGFMEFFGSTTRIYIGHDKGVTRIDFDGTNETFVGAVGSWTQNVPRPMTQFLGNLYAGNGSNLTEIIQAGTVSTYAKLSPAFPTNTQVRDLDVVPDGTYVQAVVTDLAMTDIITPNPDTSTLAPSNSYIFKWNGTDTGYTAYNTYPQVALSANAIFGDTNYAFGYDFLGGAMFNPTNKFLTSSVDSTFIEAPFPNAVLPMSNLITWLTPLQFDGVLTGIWSIFGTISDWEIEKGYWCPLFFNASGDETDVNRIPCQILVSNYGVGSSFSGYTNQVFGTPKIYFSTIESSSTPTTKYKLYKWSPAPIGNSDAQEGLYQTQKQTFSKKVKPTEVRIYAQPWVANNSFTVDLIGSAGTPITGASKTFTAGSNLTVGDDFAWYTPASAPTYTMGLRITNAGTANMEIMKVEIDYTQAGQ